MDNRDKKVQCEFLTSEQNKSTKIKNSKVVDRNQTNIADVTGNDISTFSNENNNNTPWRGNTGLASGGEQPSLKGR